MAWNETHERRSEAIKEGLRMYGREKRVLADAVIDMAIWITRNAPGRTFRFVPKKGGEE